MIEGRKVGVDTPLDAKSDHSRKLVEEATMVIGALLADRYPELSCSLVLLHGNVSECSVRGVASPALMETMEKALEQVFELFRAEHPLEAKQFMVEKMMSTLAHLEAKNNRTS